MVISISSNAIYLYLIFSAVTGFLATWFFVETPDSYITLGTPSMSDQQKEALGISFLFLINSVFAPIIVFVLIYLLLNDE
jgi:uncharacterized paraquat-inducible protein A